MSDTAYDQLLCPSIEKITEGICEFGEAVSARVSDAREWKPEHLVKITDIASRLQALRVELAILERTVR